MVGGEINRRPGILACYVHVWVRRTEPLARTPRPAGGEAVKRSEGLKLCAQLGIGLSVAQDARILYAESNGLRFAVDFGHGSTMEDINRAIVEQTAKRPDRSAP